MSTEAEVIDQRVELAQYDAGRAQLPVAAQELNVGALMQQIVDKGVTGEAVAVMKDLMAMQERLDARRAEQAFTAAFARLQSALPKIRTTKPVPDKSGVTKYWYAEFDKILDIVEPILQQHGFAVSFDTRREAGFLTAICTLSHEGGHSRRNEFSIRVGSGPPGATEAQADGSARSYAKRFALTDALNLNIERGHDDDGASTGDVITAEQAADLRALLEDTKGDERAMLALAEVDSIERIKPAQYGMICRLLREKQRRARGAQP